LSSGDSHPDLAQAAEEALLRQLPPLAVAVDGLFDVLRSLLAEDDGYAEAGPGIALLERHPAAVAGLAPPPTPICD
jgi:hypothetical protein